MPHPEWVRLEKNIPRVFETLTFIYHSPEIRYDRMIDSTSRSISCRPPEGDCRPLVFRAHLRHPLLTYFSCSGYMRHARTHTYSRARTQTHKRTRGASLGMIEFTVSVDRTWTLLSMGLFVGGERCGTCYVDEGEHLSLLTASHRYRSVSSIVYVRLFVRATEE